MKKTLIALFALTGVIKGESLTLPDYDTNPSQAGDWWNLNKASGKGYGYYVGTGRGPIEGNWHTTYIEIDNTKYYEGDWNNDIVALAGRGGTGGISASFVFGQDIKIDSIVNNITFTASGYKANLVEGDITLTLAIRDKDNNQINNIADKSITIADKSITFDSQTENITSLTLDGVVEWKEGYKIIAHITGIDTKTPSATTVYAITGIKATADIIPEPATATLSLLALAGLAGRRRRR